MASDSDILGLLEAGSPDALGVGRSTGDPHILGLLESNPAPSEQPPAPAPQAPSDYGMADFAARGATLGGFDKALALARSKLKGTPYDYELSHLDIARNAYKEAEPLKSSVAEFAGELAPTIPLMGVAGKLGSAALMDGGKLAGRIGGYLASGAAYGAANYPLSEHPDMISSVQEGALGGLVGGPIGDLIAGPLANKITPEIANVAQKFLGEGNKLYPAQIPGAPGASKVLGNAPSAEQLAALTRGVSRTFGQDADQITPELIAKAKSDAGKLIESGAQGANIPWNDPALRTGIVDTYRSALNKVGGDRENPAFKAFGKLYDQIAGAAQRTGTIPGDVFATLTRKGSSLDAATSRASPLRYEAIQLKSLLLDALERNNPSAAQDFFAGRHMWHNAVLAEDAVGSDFKIDPKRLASLVEGRQGYGSFPTASKKAAQAGVDSDIGTLGQGAGMFLTGKAGGVPGYIGHHPVLGMGGIYGAIEAAKEGIPHAMEYLPHDLSMLGAGVGGAYAGAGALLSRPWMTPALLAGLNPGALGRAAIPVGASYINSRNGNSGQ